MTLLSQVAELLSQPPGNLVYHFGILFAIEATLAIALGYRQRPAVRRVAVAAAGMLIGRLALMVVALLDWQGLVGSPATVLPPLERAVDAIGVWLIVWALLPLFDNLPAWGDLLGAGVSFLLGALYLVFALVWRPDPGAAAAYNGSSQETVWEVIQLGILGAASLHTLLYRRGDWTLRLGILLVLLTGHVVHFGWASPGENVAAWERLAQLVAYPLFTVSAYRLVVGQLLQGAGRTAEQAGLGWLEQSRRLGAVSIGQEPAAIANAAVAAVATATGADPVAYASLGEAEGEVALAAVYGSQPFSPRLPKSLNLSDAPALRRAINYKQPLYLRPGGGEDQSRVSLLMQLLPGTGLGPQLQSRLIIQPVAQEDQLYGALLVVFGPAADSSDDWMTTNRHWLELVSDQMAAALDQASGRQRLVARVARLSKQLEVIEAAAIKRLAQLQEELLETRQREQELALQLDQTQLEVARAQQHSQDLAMILDAQTAAAPAGETEEAAEWEELDIDEIAELAAFQQELRALTAEIEQAGRQGADGDWESETLFAQGVLSRTGNGLEAQVAQVAQELRGPMTSITGYTDLLLSGSLGSVGDLQRMLLQRVRASSERARVLLDELVRVAGQGQEPAPQDLKPVNVVQVIQNTVLEFSQQVGEKGLDLQLDLDDALPLLEMDRNGFDQIVFNLLSNAILASPPSSRVAIEARYEEGQTGPDDGDSRAKGFLFLAVRDSGGGIGQSEQPHVFDRAYRSDHPTIAGVGDTGQGLPLVHELVQAQFGRIWIESEPEVGSTLSLVLPVAAL